MNLSAKGQIRNNFLILFRFKKMSTIRCDLCNHKCIPKGSCPLSRPTCCPRVVVLCSQCTRTGLSIRSSKVYNKFTDLNGDNKPCVHSKLHMAEVEFAT